VNERLLTAAEAAELLAVPESWVPEHTSYGTLPRVELGRYVRYRRDAILAWVEGRQASGRPARARTYAVWPRIGAAPPALCGPTCLPAGVEQTCAAVLRLARSHHQPRASICAPSGAVGQSPPPEGASR
jgi:excisionase family DNA binding protein